MTHFMVVEMMLVTLSIYKMLGVAEITKWQCMCVFCWAYLRLIKSYHYCYFDLCCYKNNLLQ